MGLGLIAVWMVWASPGVGIDYGIDSGKVIGQLVDGNVHRFFVDQPMMGTLPIMLSGPFALLSLLGSGSELLQYRFAILPELLATAAFALFVGREMSRRGSPLGLQVLVAGLCLVNPATLEAIHWGHPEDLLAGTLCVAAVLAGLKRQPVLAGVLLGLALGTENWPVLAIPAVLLAAPPKRVKLLAIAAGIAIVLSAPLLIGDSDRFIATQSAPVVASTMVSSTSVVYPFAHHRDVTVSDGVKNVVRDRVTAQPGLAKLSLTLMVLLTLVTSAVAWLRRRHLPPGAPLLLVALAFLGAASFSIANLGYFYVGPLLALLAWEGLHRQRLPIASMLLALCVYLTYVNQLDGNTDPELFYAFTMSWTAGFAGYLMLELYAPAAVKALGRRLRISVPDSLTTTRSSIRTPSSPGT